MSENNKYELCSKKIGKVSSRKNLKVNTQKISAYRRWRTYGMGPKNKAKSFFEINNRIINDLIDKYKIRHDAHKSTNVRVIFLPNNIRSDCKR